MNTGSYLRPAPAGEECVEGEPRRRVEGEDTGIRPRCPRVPGGQGHNALKGGLRGNDIADHGHRSAHPDQGAQNRNRDERQHDNFDIDHANHQTIGKPHTLEGKIVRLSDKIAYIHHDMDDAVRAGILKESDVPAEIREVIGSTPGGRLDCFIHDIVTASMGKNDIQMSPPVEEAMMKMRRFMCENVYYNPLAKSEESKAEMLMETLYQHFMKHIDELPGEFLDLLSEGEAKEQVICDYVGAMTDRFAIATYDDIYIPKSWSI